MTKDYETEAYKQAAIALLESNVAEKIIEYVEEITTHIEDIANIMARNIGTDIRCARTAAISAFLHFIVVFLYNKFGDVVEKALELLSDRSDTEKIEKAEKFADKVLKEVLDEYESYKD